MSAHRRESDPRSRVLETALRLFYEQGYHATGINQIIAEADVAKASLYDHFSSKEALAVAYMEETLARWQQRLHTLAAAGSDPLERIFILFDALEAAFEPGEYRGCAFLNMATEFPDLDAPVHAEVRHQKTLLRDYIREQLALAFPQLDEAERVGRADGIFLLFEGALVEMRSFDSAWPARAAKEAARALLP